MHDISHSPFTIIYSCNSSIVIAHEVLYLPFKKGQRVIIPHSYKKDKIIIAVCEGKVNVLNALGERIIADADSGAA